MNVDEPSYVGDNSFRIVPTSNENWYSYTTNADTQYVLVERNAKDVKAYEAALAAGATYNNPNNFEWNVLPGKLGNMDDDRLADYVQTYVTVAKAEDNVAELVYIYQITPDINPEQYTVRLVDAAGNFINSDRVEKGQTASIAYTAPAGYNVVLDNPAAKYEDGKVILPNVTANTTIIVNLEKILDKYTLTLKGNLAGAEVWNEDGTKKLGATTTTDINGVQTTTIDLTEGQKVIIKDTDINTGSYLYNGKVVTINTEDQMVVEMTGDITLNGAPSDKLYVINLAKGLKAEATNCQWSEQEGNILYMLGAGKITVSDEDDKTVGEYIVTTSDSTLSWAKAGVTKYIATEGTAYDLSADNAANYQLYVKPVADVTVDSTITATLPDGKTTLTVNTPYVVVIGTELDLDAVGTYAPYEGTATGYGVAIEKPYEVKADATIYAGYIVTLGKGVTAKVGDVDCAEGDKIAVSGSCTGIDTLKSPVGTTIIEAPANNGVLVLDSDKTVVTNAIAITKNMTLVAAVKVTAGTNVTIKFLGNGTNEMSFDNTDPAYVLPGTTLHAIASGNKTITVTDAAEVGAPVEGSVKFVVGEKDITVSAS